jgi:hypothetical protein
MPSEPKTRNSGTDARTLLRPKNLLKTAASLVPVASAFSEALGQLEAAEMEQRVEQLESWRQLRELEKANPKSPPPPLDWPATVAEFYARTADLCVFYDGGVESRTKRGKELFLHVAHACVIDPTHFLTTTAALHLARDVAADRKGRLVLVIGMRHFAVDLHDVEDRVSLSVGKIGPVDTACDEKLSRTCREAGVEPLTFPLPAKQVQHTLTPWIGTEVGFLHAGETADAMRPDRLTRMQFDTSTISHLREPSREVLKAAVTGVLGGRFVCLGSPVFTRSGVLVGCVGESTHYESDAGRRAVIYGLLGHPFFTPSMRKA